jgi:PII-like signaling protein
LSEDLPIVIEIVDSEENVGRIMPKLDGMIAEGLVTTERVHVIAYRGAGAAAHAPVEDVEKGGTW